MDIKRTKQEIHNTVKAYLAKDAFGEYVIPAIRQRPILMMGPPGIGKTQIMEQVTQECGIALVAYTITHHTRQSAVGLPFVRQRHYGSEEVSVTEYTMSEIIASIYDKMESTGLSEGILFIDEINCVSETLAPTMLQFLQCKTFGNRAIPTGWVIVAAGNPPEYNKSVREFDIVTLDRVKRIDLDPSLPAFREYAIAAHLHSSILSYLALHPDHFYQINADVDGTQFVTARGWEDLSNLLDSYESIGLVADEEVIHQYIQHQKIAAEFSAYLDLFYKYRDNYGVEEILAGTPNTNAYARVMHAPFDERLSLISLLLSGLDTHFIRAIAADEQTEACYHQLRAYQKMLADTAPTPTSTPSKITRADEETSNFFHIAPPSARHGGTSQTNQPAQAQESSSVNTRPLPSTLWADFCEQYAAETQRLTEAKLLTKSMRETRHATLATMKSWLPALHGIFEENHAFQTLKTQFAALSTTRQHLQDAAMQALEYAFDFLDNAFGESQEMIVFVTELTLSPRAVKLISENQCERYYTYSRNLQLDSRKAALQQELAREEAQNGL